MGIFAMHLSTAFQRQSCLAVKEREWSAFARVAAADPDVRLLLCGVIENLDYHAAIVSLVGELGLADRVEMTGPQGNVPEILWESHAFAMPSSCEAHSVGFLEALASGIPVVANTIASFAFANTLPGVRLVDTRDADGYGRALLAALTTPRAMRLLSGLTLHGTAERYLAIARGVLGPQARFEEVGRL